MTLVIVLVISFLIGVAAELFAKRMLNIKGIQHLLFISFVTAAVFCIIKFLGFGE